MKLHSLLEGAIQNRAEVTPKGGFGSSLERGVIDFPRISWVRVSPGLSHAEGGRAFSSWVFVTGLCSTQLKEQASHMLRSKQVICFYPKRALSGIWVLIDRERWAFSTLNHRKRFPVIFQLSPLCVKLWTWFYHKDKTPVLSWIFEASQVHT